MENRQLFNYHTHTYRCGHAKLCEDEEYVLSAIKAGFKILGFSDHGPYKESDKKSDRMNYSQLSDYLNSINSLKIKYQDQITIRTGFEVEYFDEHLDQIEELAQKVDYLLLGQHYPDPSGNQDYAHDHVTREQLLHYGEFIEKGLKAHKFLYLAHPDYFCGGIYDFNEDCVAISHQICKAAVETNTPLEINIKLAKRVPQQYKDGMHIMYPYRAFWEIASQYPVKVIYGFDAHDPEILQRFDMYTKADEILQGIKLDFIKEPLI